MKRSNTIAIIIGVVILIIMIIGIIVYFAIFHHKDNKPGGGGGSGGGGSECGGSGGGGSGGGGSGCKDTNCNFKNQDGQGCSAYSSGQTVCGTRDTLNFVSEKMCCACGGGDHTNGEPTYSCENGRCLYATDGKGKYKTKECLGGWSCVDGKCVTGGSCGQYHDDTCGGATKYSCIDGQCKQTPCGETTSANCDGEDRYRCINGQCKQDNCGQSIGEAGCDITCDSNIPGCTDESECPINNVSEICCKHFDAKNPCNCYNFGTKADLSSICGSASMKTGICNTCKSTINTTKIDCSNTLTDSTPDLCTINHSSDVADLININKGKVQQPLVGVPSAYACQDICGIYDDCKYWTYSNGSCWLQSTTGKPPDIGNLNSTITHGQKECAKNNK
jgi:hypothetical protein